MLCKNLSANGIVHSPSTHRLPLIRSYLKLTHEFEIKKFCFQAHDIT